MYRRYYSYNDMPQIARPPTPRREENHERPQKAADEQKPQEHVSKNAAPSGGLFEGGKLFGKFETDDVILLIIVAALILDDCDDKLLLAALGFIFLTGL